MIMMIINKIFQRVGGSGGGKSRRGVVGEQGRGRWWVEQGRWRWWVEQGGEVVGEQGRGGGGGTGEGEVLGGTGRGNQERGVRGDRKE